MKKFSNQDGAIIIDNMILAIQENKQYLSDIDGLIGDGDHGINMNKGFTMCREELDKNPGDLAHSAKTLSKILMMKIGGSMGPLYGKLYRGFAKELNGIEEIGIEDMGAALDGMLSSIQTISTAKPGDKTLIDTLSPAVKAYKKAASEGQEFDVALDEMKAAAIAGRDSTKDMVAQLGRASRLGERSRGVFDAGATSCCLLLEVLANTSKELLK
ncbi:dihydroxyacetone kinase subunit DhaL [Draconibacterium sp.]|nr:dihydroxyacetone kinase subunit DhaL [Draconibacterium sp.]